MKYDLTEIPGIISGALQIIRALVLLPLSIAPVAIAAGQRIAADVGITGLVVAPDGSPVTQGNVALVAPLAQVARGTTAIDASGHFRIISDSVGPHRLFISVPGFAPHRVTVTVPPSRRMPLPEITLNEATYFRARFQTSEGEPLAATGLRRRSIDRDGVTIADPLGHVREQIEADGSITIGPLPHGRTIAAFDRAPFAQTRLPDLDVTGSRRMIEGGTITIAPGARLDVDVSDGTGQAVARHEIWLEDASRPTPLTFPVARTDAGGRASFDRLASGRYRVWTRTVDRCNNQELILSRLVSTGNTGVSNMRLVVGGRAAFRITSALGSIPGRPVFASPDAPPGTPWQSPPLELLPSRRVAARSPSSCGGVTDADGRIMITPFPPGPSQLRVALFNSTFFARVTVPDGGREMVIAIPDGLLPVRVIDHATRQPIAQAQVTWVGGGGRVEALGTPNGDALLESVGRNGGTLTIAAAGYETLEGRFDETPETLQEVALARSAAARLTVRVIGGEGEPLAGAIVERLARDAGDVADFVMADSSGGATFVDVPAGQLRFIARAEGFTAATASVGEEGRGSIVITLKRKGL